MANINKNIIMQAGAAVANAAKKAAGLTAATPEPGSIISVIQLVNGGRTIGPDALAHLTESVRNKLLSLLVSMKPIQDFNGYGHPWPAGGGVNKLLPRTEDYSDTTAYGISYSYDLDTETLQVSGTNTDAAGHGFYSVQISSGKVIIDATPTAGDTYYFGAEMPQGTYAQIVYTKSGGGVSVLKYINGTGSLSVSEVTIPNDFAGFNRFDVGVAPSVTIEGNLRFIFSSITPPSWTPYSNICPMSGRTGLNVYAGPTDSIGDAATYSMNWTSPAGTVYAGSADIVSGDIKAAPYYASYNGETLVGPWVSSMDEYDPEGTPTTGAQVVDLGGTMTEYHITGQDIITLVGDNYIWSDSGNVTITE